MATLIVTSNCQWDPAEGAAKPLKPDQLEHTPDKAIKASAEILRKSGAKAVLFLGGRAMRERALKAAARIAKKCGCGLVRETVPGRIERRGAIPPVEKTPHFPEPARASPS